MIIVFQESMKCHEIIFTLIFLATIMVAFDTGTPLILHPHLLCQRNNGTLLLVTKSLCLVLSGKVGGGWVCVVCVCVCVCVCKQDTPT